jgi:hypothetical protein
MYIGNNFTTGYIQGTSSIQGSVMGLINGAIGNDASATAQFNPILSGNNGGVITNSILSYVQSNFNSSTPLTMSYTYNSDGDRALSSYAGSYVNGSSSVTIAANGQISATYPAPLFIAFDADQMCSISVTVAPTTAMKAVKISGTDDCSRSVSMSFFSLTLSGVSRLVLRLSLANNLSTKAVVF